jgi:hypothetical protein
MTGMTACVKRNVPVRLEQRLPFRQRQSIRGGCGVGDDGAAAHGIDEDVDTAEALGRVCNRAVHPTLVERIDVVGMGLAAGRRDLGDGLIQPCPIGIDGGDAPALAADDVGGRATNPARRGRDDRDLALETHGLPLPCCPAHCPGA